LQICFIKNKDALIKPVGWNQGQWHEKT